MDCYAIYYVITGTISVLGLIGNGITFFTFGKNCIQNSSTFLFRALACVDNFFLFICAIRLILIMNNSGSFWMLVADFYIMIPLREIARAATVWTILLVGVHRHIVICKPLKAARLCTVGNARRHFLGVILFLLVVNFPLFFCYRIIERQETSNSTDNNSTYAYVVDTKMNRSPWFSFLYDLAFRIGFVNYVLPVVSLIFITVRLLQSLRSLSRRRMELSGRQRHVQRDIRSECMVIVVLIVFMLCHTGLPIALILRRIDWNIFLGENTPICKTVYFSLFALSYGLPLLNSSVNIIIYLVFNRKFGRSLCPSLRSVSRRPNQQNWHTTMSSTD